ncbi:P-loop NTPase fold protein [Polaribacter sp. M15]
MKTAHIEKIIEKYLKKENTQSAILINGVWGSGKTFYLNSQLKEIIVKNNLKVMYISLNGISSIESLEHKLFLHFIPKLGENQSDLVKSITNISTNIANATTKLFFRTEATDLLKGSTVKSFNFKKYCICLDDLERCKIPIDELIGYLSEFTEHKHTKCIILADEEKIKKQKSNKQLAHKYDEIKEKVISRVLNFNPELEDVFPKLIEKYKSKKIFYKFLNESQKFIISIFKEQKSKNLRNIIFYLDILEAVYPNIKKADQKYINEVLFSTAIFSIEFKNGNLTSKDSNDFKEFGNINKDWYSRIVSNFLNDKSDKPRKKSNPELFYDRYLTNRIDQYFFYPSIYKFVLSGYLDNKKLRKELENREPEKISEEITSFRKLLNYKFRELDDNEFENLSKYVIKKAATGIYWMYDYKQIANFYFHFLENGLISISKKDLEKTLLDGLKISAKRKEFHLATFETLKHFNTPDPDTKKILDKIFEFHNKIQSENNTKTSMKLSKLISNNDIVNLAVLFSEQKFNKDFIPLVNVTSFIKAVKSSKNKMIFSLCEIFKDRYDYSNVIDFMEGDLDFLNKILLKIKLYKTTLKPEEKLRNFNLNEFIDALEEITKKLSKDVE